MIKKIYFCRNIHDLIINNLLIIEIYRCIEIYRICIENRWYIHIDIFLYVNRWYYIRKKILNNIRYEFNMKFNICIIIYVVLILTDKKFKN